MIKQTWDVSKEDRERILHLHESATKRHYLLNEQEITTKKINFEDELFESGKFELNQKFKTQISQKVLELVNEIKEKNIKDFTIQIDSGESQVTNPQGFEEKGSLAKARAEELKKYLESILPNMLNFKPKIIVTEPKIGQTPYDKTKDYVKKDDPQYKEEQFVTAKIVTDIESPYSRKSDVGEGIYVGGILKGFISEPFVNTTDIRDSGNQSLGRQELIFTEIKKDTLPFQILGKYKIPFSWWNTRFNAGTNSLRQEDLEYIRTNFPKVS